MTVPASLRRLGSTALAGLLVCGLFFGSYSAQARSLETSTRVNTTVSGDVVFWNAYNTVSPENSTLITKVIPAFQKLYPNVTVYSQNIPYSSMLQKLIASIAAGSGPDVVRSDIIWVPQLASIGALEPLDTVMSNFAMLKNAVYPGPLATNYYKGHYYGLPLDTNTRVLIYNKAVLAKAGIKTPPTTTADFMADAQKIATLGKGVFGYAEGGLDGWNILPWFWTFGGAVTDSKFTKASGYVNSAASIAALTYLVSLKDSGALSPSILGGGLSTSDAIGKGQAGFIIDGPWMPPIFQATYPKLQFGMSLMPSGPNAQSASVVGGEDIVIMKSTKNLAAAKAFTTFMLGQEAQVDMGKVGQMPVLKSLANSSQLPAYFKVFADQLKTAQPRTVSPNWQKIDADLTTAFQQAFRHQATPTAALNTAATQIDALLK